MSTLLIFGDSWPYGSELTPDEQPYGNLLYQRVGCDNVKLFAQPSTSIPHLILQLRNAIAQGISGTKAVFFLTGIDRDLVWEEHCTRELSPTNPDNIDWYAKYNSPELSQYRVNVTLIALQSMCAKYSIDDYYVWGWDRVDLWPEVDTTKFYANTVADEFLGQADVPHTFSKINHLKNSKNQYIWPNLGHPNQLGHQRIADMLAEWICT
jgi:hypothetical protein